MSEYEVIFMIKSEITVVIETLKRFLFETATSDSSHFTGSPIMKTVSHTYNVIILNWLHHTQLRHIHWSSDCEICLSSASSIGI